MRQPKRCPDRQRGRAQQVVTLTTDTAVALQLVERRRLLVSALAVALAASSAVRLTSAAKRAFSRPPVRSHPAPAAVRISAADSVVEELSFWMVANDVWRDAAKVLKMLVSCTTSSCMQRTAALQNLVGNHAWPTHRARCSVSCLEAKAGSGPLVAASSVLGADLLTGGPQCVPALTN